MTTTKKESEILKELIAQNRQRIKIAEGEIVTLNRRLMAGPGVDKRAIPDQLAALRSKIANYENAIATHERRLPQVEQMEAIYEQAEAQAAQRQAQADAQAKAAREGAIKEAALTAYLENGGSHSGFATAWPGIQTKIAEQEATSAAQRVANEQRDAKSAGANVAHSILAAKYRQVKRPA